MTNEEGIFDLNEKKGNYILTVSFIGYSPYSQKILVEDKQIDLGNLILERDEKILDAVTVQGTKSLIEHNSDRLIFNVESSVAASGGNAWQILSKTPGVRIDRGEEPNIVGKQGTMVMIDDRVMKLSPSELKSLLQNMSADHISSIDVITSPSAKYEAQGAGGIIQIKRKKSQSYGITGNLNLAYDQRVFDSYSGGANLNLRNEKFDIYARYSQSQDKNQWGDDMGMLIADNLVQVDLLGEGGGNAYKMEGGIDYHIDNRNVIGLQLEHSTSNYNFLDRTENRTGSLQQPIQTFESAMDGEEGMKALNLHYSNEIDTLGRLLKIDLDYFTNKNNTAQNLFDNGIKANGEKNGELYSSGNSQQDMVLKSFQIDYIHPSKKGILEIGTKISYNYRESGYDFFQVIGNQLVKDKDVSNQFNFKETIGALYANYKISFKDNLNLNGGLRGEYTNTQQSSLHQIPRNYKKEYLNIFPSISINYQTRKENQWVLSYGKRIQRPMYFSLNPFRFYGNPFIYSEGNPFLKPSIVHNTELGFILKGNYSIKVFYQYLEDPFFGQIPQWDEDNDLIGLKPNNLPSSHRYGLNLLIPVSLTNWWSLTNTLNVMMRDETFVYLGEDVHNQVLSAQFSISNSISLPKGFRAEISGWYNSPHTQYVFNYRSTYDISFGIKKSVLKDKGTLALNATDLFKGNFSPSKMDLKYLKGERLSTWNSQSLRISFSYRFGKSTVKTIQERKTSNQDERNRL
ncbi:TonB-dependent receptor domain-containing protein [Xanthovirga aplysinae]|uniref:TonB-dependent receptor domain-containing protein n=1 Tax=Xanthovirga aplysinae TaxID=2529853 RepID=UPI0012BC3A7C|nr:TonB-dependent receptor [Xanthovirga aplysinae]MTI31509.1 TonB-dependent receptor [Xanthovirga aplysinae]